MSPHHHRHRTHHQMIRVRLHLIDLAQIQRHHFQKYVKGQPVQSLHFLRLDHIHIRRLYDYQELNFDFVLENQRDQEDVRKMLLLYFPPLALLFRSELLHLVLYTDIILIISF